MKPPVVPILLACVIAGLMPVLQSAERTSADFRMSAKASSEARARTELERLRKAP